MNRLRACLAGLLLGLFSLFGWAEPASDTGLVAIPALTARVTDLTGTLSADTKAALEQQLATFEARKGAQLVVLVLPTTQPEAIEQFGIRLFDAWKIGRKGVEDGVMLIIAKNDRKLRIEVGYGLEGALNDATAKRIIDEIMAPPLRKGDIPGGIQAGVDAILKVVDGETLPPPKPAATSNGGGGMGLSDIPQFAFFAILFAVIVGGSFLRRMLGNLLGCAVAGGLSGGLGWLVIGGIGGLVGGALAGIFLSIFGLDLLLSGILSGGRGGGFGGGGGGFGGGGGSGGGGGASGSW